MKNDYEEVQIDESKNVLNQITTPLWKGLTGLADWIGLGGWIRGKLEKDRSYKGLQSLKSKIRDRINYLASKGQIDFEKVESKLNDLKSAGFSLTGLALKRFQETANDVQKQYDEARNKKADLDLNLTKAQTDLDKLNAESDDIAGIDAQTAAAEKIIGQLE